MPTATPVKFYAFVENVAEKVHNLGADALTYALTNSAPVVTNTILGNITQIDYSHCSSRVPTINSSAQTAGLYKLILADLTLTASGGDIGPFQWVVLYNDTPTSPADPLILYADYGGPITIHDGETFIIDADQINGILTLQ